MLGNQYFMVRKYLAASKEFEKALMADCCNYTVMKKLIICYTQTNRPFNALELFYEVIRRDIGIIVNTDPIAVDCPCPGLIGEVENGAVKYEDKFIVKCMLGILWLYCDMSVSLRCLKQACDMEQGNSLLNNIIRVYEDYLKLNPQ
jgi:tetratricopeptide (TPR) repeat protein